MKGKKHMGKKKSNTRSRRAGKGEEVDTFVYDEKTSAASTAGSEDNETKDLRKVPPVERLRGLQSVCRAKLEKDLVKLNAWQNYTENESLKEAALTLGEILNSFKILDEQLKELEDSGFSPARKSYTAKAGEGDRVSVLEEKREAYSDLMDPIKMVDLLVVKKRPGKTGGLVVEAEDNSRMQVAVAHVVRLSQAAT
jgi:hypothetical protein